MQSLVTKAVEYLEAEVGSISPQELRLVAAFDRSPLNGPGETGIFEFHSAVGSATSKRYFVVSAPNGLTNYYPDWGLSVNELWKAHIGLEFKLGSHPAPKERVPRKNEAQKLEALVKRLIEQRGESPGSIHIEHVHSIEDAAPIIPTRVLTGRCMIDGYTWLFAASEHRLQIYDNAIPSFVAWRLFIGALIVEHGGLPN